MPLPTILAEARDAHASAIARRENGPPASITNAKKRRSWIRHAEHLVRRFGDILDTFLEQETSPPPPSVLVNDQPTAASSSSLLPAGTPLPLRPSPASRPAASSPAPPISSRIPVTPGGRTDFFLLAVYTAQDKSRRDGQNAADTPERPAAKLRTAEPENKAASPASDIFFGLMRGDDNI